MKYKTFICDGCHKETPRFKDEDVCEFNIHIKDNQDHGAYNEARESFCVELDKEVAEICRGCAEAVNKGVIDIFNSRKLIK